MPSIRVTIASNANQSLRAPLLLPSSIDDISYTYQSLIFKAASSKLRLKKPTRIYVSPTGIELVSSCDFSSVLKPDLLLLVSQGEAYVGALTLSNPAHPEANPDCAITSLAHTAQVDPLALTQLETTARTLPGLIQAVAQPDLHPGNKYPVGAVFVSEGWVHPPLIGSDIGCGMTWLRTGLSRGHVEGDKGRKVAESLRGLEGAWRSQADREVWLSSSERVSCSAGVEYDKSLGTIGAGNHFAEIQVIESSALPPSLSSTAPSLGEGEVVLLIHSGSRGYGGDILRRHTATSSGPKTSFPATSPEASLYLRDHDRACRWAALNRLLIGLRFLACLEPGDPVWSLGRNSSSPTDAFTILTARTAVERRRVLDIHHNNISSHRYPPSPPPSPQSPLPPPPATEKSTVFIHRKGAAPTLSPVPPHLPLPFVPLPGSRATPTLILVPTFSAATAHGALNALSLAHGAGRAMSRAQAAIWVAKKYAGRSGDLLSGAWNGPSGRQATPSGDAESEGRAVHGGCWVVCEDKALVWEEAGEAYKDVWDVGADLERSGAAQVAGWARGRVSYKCRME